MKAISPRKICFITGTRADFGIMSRLMKDLSQVEGVTLQIVATNMHLSARHGMTVDEITAEGLHVDERVEMDLSGDDRRSTVKSMSQCLGGMADALDRLKPDICVILGDRYEMLAAASAAMIMGVPVAHLYGGEITEGAYDDSIRHAITKLSRIHFTSTEEYRRRIIAMGEDPSTVYRVGALGADNIASMSVMTLGELEESLGMSLSDEFLLATFHPVTLEPGQAAAQTRALLEALEERLGQTKVLFTMPNSDSEGDTVASLITAWVQRHPGCVKAVASLGRARYYSALRHCMAVVGNSSSGLTEAPSMGVPTLNIGNRQRGRAQGATIVNCEATRGDISAGLDMVMSREMRDRCRRNPDNPYAFHGTLEAIMKVLLSTPLPLPAFKPFYDVAW